MDLTFWRGRRVFVTGASGLLGSSLVEALLEQGAEVVCLVRDWVPASRLLESALLARAVLVPGKLEDLACLERAINEYDINTVFHLGAQTLVTVADRGPLTTFESNIRGTWNLCEACRRFPRVESIVVASSDKAYGDHKKLPYTEETPLLARQPYDVSKACAELIAQSYVHAWELPLAVTRCGNLFGPGDLNFDRLVPGTIRSVLRDEPVVIRSDGQYVRDYFYVRDAARACMLLAQALPERGLAGEAFNFGYEQPMTVLELVQQILRLMGREDVSPIVLDQAGKEIRRQALDCSKARRKLGWKPVFDLEGGLRETIAWYRDWHQAGVDHGQSR